MVFSRLILAVSATAGALLLSTVLLSVWQHNAAMDEMMPGMTGMSMSGMMWWFYLPLIVAAMLLITLPAILYFSAKDVSVVAGLTAEEKAVVDFLTRNGGKVEQRTISKELGISRVKTHRLITSLKRRDVVEVERRGRTNLVKLKASQQH